MTWNANFARYFADLIEIDAAHDVGRHTTCYMPLLRCVAKKLSAKRRKRSTAALF
jgi:hypothetical protein